jgi:hypothetical protein
MSNIVEKIDLTDASLDVLVAALVKVRDAYNNSAVPIHVQDNEAFPFDSLNVRQETLSDSSVCYSVELDNGVRD